ncbi:MAG: C4-dicarboxylate transporter DcuC [Sutterella wadsworthensis]
MLGILITVAVIAVVAYCVLKNYYPPIVLLLAGLLMLVCAWLMGVDPVDAKKSTNFVGFDFVQAFTNQMKGRLPGLGLNIMLIAGFSFYMDRIGASKALVKLCVKPLSAVRSPYVLLAITYVVGQFMALFINSAVGLGLLLMASVYPLLVALGVSRASAAAVIGSTCCLDLGPSSSNAMRAADLMSTDVVTYFVQSQIPVAVCVIATVAIGHFFVQRWFDQRDAARGVADGAPVKADQKDLEKAFEGAGPVHYALLPMLPLVLLIVFSPMVYDGIKLSLQTGILVSILIAFFVDLITHFDFKECCKRTSAVFEGMGKVFTSTVALICCAELFALGMNKTGRHHHDDSRPQLPWRAPASWVMLFIMLGIMVVATIVTGSGNAAFFAFSPLLPEAAASVGINTAVLVVPVQLSAGIARTMCPIAGVIIAVAGIAGLTPFEIIRRTIPVMLLALIVNVAASAIFL